MVDWSKQRVLVTGGAGFLGRAVVAGLRARGVPEHSIWVPRSAEFNLLSGQRVGELLARCMPVTLVIHCAGMVGGLGLNRSHPAGMFHKNLQMTMNVVEAARAASSPPFGGPSGMTKVVLIGSMTSYPAEAPLPYQEESLFRGLPDAEIASYGIAKLAGLQMLKAYHLEHGMRSAFPVLVNLYGPGDNIDDPKVSHVAGALIKRFVDAAEEKLPEVVCWGTGAPTRDFVFVEDAAEGVIRCAEAIDADGEAKPPLVVNIASGREVSIKALAEMIARVAGYSGRIVWDASKGDGVSRRCLDVSRARETLGWSARVGLEEGMARTVAWYRAKRRGGG